MFSHKWLWLPILPKKLGEHPNSCILVFIGCSPRVVVRGPGSDPSPPHHRKVSNCPGAAPSLAHDHVGNQPCPKGGRGLLKLPPRRPVENHPERAELFNPLLLVIQLYLLLHRYYTPLPIITPLLHTIIVNSCLTHSLVDNYSGCLLITIINHYNPQVSHPRLQHF